MSAAESLELFLQEASDHLQYLREYSGLVQEPQARAEDFEKLYIAAHTLCGTSGSFGFPLFSEVAGKLAHIFQYAMNARLGPDTHGPLTEFLADAVSVLEFDLLQIANDGTECAPDIAAFKQRYGFAFPAALDEAGTMEGEIVAGDAVGSEAAAAGAASFVDSLPEDSDIPAEVLEVFVAEAEEHFQTVTECLLALEGNPNAEDINRLFRAIHTVKGSAAQVGVHRCAVVAHRVEELIGRIRDGRLQPNAEIVDLCLDAVDALKKLLHHSWTDDAEMRAKLEPLLARIEELAPAGTEEPAMDVVEAADAGAAEEAPDAELSPAATQTAAVRRAAPAVVAAAAAAQAKSVRISLDRLDRMMNAVGELVINRTRMLGRLSELSKLVEVLTFSKARLSLKVSEFQDKHEFSRISSSLMPGSSAPQMDTFRGFSSLPGLHGESSSGFSDLEMDRYDDFNILSRSLSEISADVTEVLSQLEAFMNRVDSDIDEFTKLAHHLQDEITRARMVPIGNLYTRLSRTVRDAAKATGKRVALVLEGAETELDNNIIQQISDPLIHLVRNAVAHGLEKPEVRSRSGKSGRRPAHRSRLSSRQSCVRRSRRRWRRNQLRKNSRAGAGIGARHLPAGRAAHRTRIARVSFSAGILYRRHQDRAGGPRRGPRCGSRQHSHSQWRYRNPLRLRRWHHIHTQSSADLDYFAGALRAQRNFRLRVPAGVRGRNTPREARGDRRSRWKAADQSARRGYRSRAPRCAARSASHRADQWLLPDGDRESRGALAGHYRRRRSRQR